MKSPIKSHSSQTFIPTPLKKERCLLKLSGMAWMSGAGGSGARDSAGGGSGAHDLGVAQGASGDGRWEWYSANPVVDIIVSINSDNKSNNGYNDTIMDLL